jgi:hypothetical protein
MNNKEVLEQIKSASLDEGLDTPELEEKAAHRMNQP